MPAAARPFPMLAGAALAALMGVAAAHAEVAAPPGFQPPSGCTAYLTVQASDCTVSHYFTCEGDPKGWQRHVDMDEQGVALSDVIDGQTQWMSIDFADPPSHEALAASNPDPASFDTLLATGLDTYDFTTDSPEYGPTRYVRHDKLTGATEVIDGVPLESTEFEMTAYDASGAQIWARKGGGFISREWRMFLGGQETVTTPDGASTPIDDTPKEFARPGERGFLSAQPKYGCNELMSSNDGPLLSPIPGGQG